MGNGPETAIAGTVMLPSWSDMAYVAGVILRFPPAASWIAATLSVGPQMKYSGNLAGRSIELAVAVGFAPKAMWQSVVDTTRTTTHPSTALSTDEAAYAR